VHVTDEYPKLEMMFAAPEQLVWVEEITRHDGAKVKCSSPVVIVLSVYVPSALAVQLPVTCSEPTTGAVGHPAPTNDKSRLPLILRHDEVTFQVPTKLPPQAVTFEQVAPIPPPPKLTFAPACSPLPALLTPDAPPLPRAPPLPVGLAEPLLHAAEITPAVTTVARAMDRNFIARLSTALRRRSSRFEATASPSLATATP
jgi:hypothetical protein